MPEKIRKFFGNEGKQVILGVTVVFAVLAVFIGAILQSSLWIFAALMILGFGIILEFISIAASKMSKLEVERRVRDASHTEEDL
jgi:4-hydroxybenzoate polyprenyltransferase